MVIDFSAFNSGATPAPVDPRVLFDSLPRAERYEFLRDPQGQVLQTWFERRNEQDLVVKLNTGGGKTLVGLLICQSSLNDGKGPALYLAPDPYLAEQAAEQAHDLGLEVTDDPRSHRFTSGEAICVLSLHRFVNGKSVFGLLGDGSRPIVDVGTIVVDDAHAALATVREKFTMTVSKQDHPETFDRLLTLFGPDLRLQSPSGYLDLTTEVPSAVLQVPFWAWSNREADVTEILQGLRDDERLQWSWPLVRDVLPVCRAVFTHDRLEIQPPHPPIGKIASFTRARRRVHLTATLADDGVLVTDFAADPASIADPITPASAGYLGDRLILAPRDISPAVTDDAVREIAVRLAERINVVVLVPSHRQALTWKDHAVLTESDSKGIGAAVRRLRDGHVGLVVLVNKYDGIDLPRTACEVLVLDGLPEAYGGLTRREQIVLGDSEGMVNRQLQRLEQGMGRGVRSVNDHCVVLLLGARLSQLIASPQYRARFGPATRAQIDLSRKVAQALARQDGDPLEKIEGVVGQVLDRDQNWIATARANLTQATYTAVALSPAAAHSRAAFAQAALRQFAEAADHMGKAVAEATDPAERGYLQEQLAAYQHFTNAAKAQQTLVKALANNPSLLRPIDGVRATRLTASDPQTVQAAKYLKRTYRDRNSLLLGVDALLADLVYDPNRVPAFEVALERLGLHLGFGAQRPDRSTGNGPDVLWATGNLRYLVLEAKSGATTDKIWRSVVEQLAHSMNWFQETYDASCSATPVLLHRSNTLEHNAVAPAGTRIITEETMSSLGQALRKAVIALADADAWADPAGVETQFRAHGILAQGIAERFSVKPRST
ncbi:DEAD/DEAH box helicase [Streptomyces alanosinicus]|uniref:DEAD/DEAH box helicase n=1 Tax=Streptomyces alanosinicus TaxID=68171 RepID=A0A918YSX4_9ACTN|nr:DEAD/DEAH box helicase [Streptomyces alanosinicus]